MIEKDREVVARQFASEDFDRKRRSGGLTASQQQALLHEYVKQWTYEVKICGRAKDGLPYEYEAATIILPSSKIVMGLSVRHFRGRIAETQASLIREEYTYER